MGKSKKRILSKNSSQKGNVLKRSEIIQSVISAVKNNKLDDETKNLISLFGINYEELAEAGATYEELAALKPIISRIV